MQTHLQLELLVSVLQCATSGAKAKLRFVLTCAHLVPGCAQVGLSIAFACLRLHRLFSVRVRIFQTWTASACTGPHPAGAVLVHEVLAASRIVVSSFASRLIWFAFASSWSWDFRISAVDPKLHRSWPRRACIRLPAFGFTSILEGLRRLWLASVRARLCKLRFLDIRAFTCSAG